MWSKFEFAENNLSTYGEKVVVFFSERDVDYSKLSDSYSFFSHRQREEFSSTLIKMPVSNLQLAREIRSNTTWSNDEA